MQDRDHHFMRLALSLAETAGRMGEVPVGAIIVKDQQILASSFNRREALQSPTAHAEIHAIELASKRLASWRLSGCTLYATLEPCLMCAGALTQSRIDRVVFGALDPKAGAVGSLYQVNCDERLNHRFDVLPGLLADESSALLKQFFKARRLG